MIYKKALILLISLSPFFALADENYMDKVEKGWFFYKEKKEQPQQEELNTIQKNEEKKKSVILVEDKCKNKKTWTASCGFVDPKGDFKFMEIQRDGLMEAMVMNSKDTKTVEQFQYFMKWAMDTSAEVAQVWKYNMVQNPELDPSVNDPISSFGVKLMTKVKDFKQESLFSAIIENEGMLFYFTKDDCDFCHAQADVVKKMEQETGIMVFQVPLDGKCLSKFKEQCVLDKRNIEVAQALKVTTVPSMSLFMKPNAWIKISNGVVDTSTMKGRLVNFFSAYRKALLSGVSNGGKAEPAMDFSTEKNNKYAGNSLVNNANEINSTKVPELKDIENLLKLSR